MKPRAPAHEAKYELAAPLYEEALALALGKSDPPTLAVCRLNVALVSVLRGDPARAHTLLREALSSVEKASARGCAYQ